MKDYIKTKIGNLYIWFRYRKYLQFHHSCHISRNCVFEGANKIYPNTLFEGYLGYGSYIGANCEIRANIDRFTSIAPYVRTNSGIHPTTTPYATTCPMFFSTRKQNGNSFADKMMFVEAKRRPHIGNDVWIGENVFIGGGKYWRRCSRLCRCCCN